MTLTSKLKKELENIVDQGITVPVKNGEYGWVDSLEIKEKPDSRLCICLDWKEINNVIKKEHHPMPTVDDITLRL